VEEVIIEERFLHTYTVKKFPSPAGMLLTKLSLGGKNIILASHREFGGK
jgi:hypothetical protein